MSLDNQYVGEDAPISAALTMKLQSIHADVAAASADEYPKAALAGVYDFMADVITAVHQLETGRPPLYESELPSD